MPRGFPLGLPLVEKLAAKKLIVLELKQEMEAQKLSKSKLAKKLIDGLLKTW